MADRKKDRKKDSQLRTGLVVAGHGHRVKVRDETGSTFNCTSRRRLAVVTGDRVLWRALRGKQGVIEECKPRDSALSRPDESGRTRVMAANIDQVMVVMAPVPVIPDVVLDAYLVAAEHLGLGARLLCNKSDLMSPQRRDEMQTRLRRYSAIGYDCLAASAKSGEAMEQLTDWLTDRASVFLGPSGVGKSSLTQHLIPGANPEVGELVRSGAHGAHTTTDSRLYFLPSGGWLIDSPGIREFGLWQIPPLDIANAFPDFRSRADNCRFRDCLHQHEPDCAVLVALATGGVASERYASYETLLRLYGNTDN